MCCVVLWLTFASCRATEQVRRYAQTLSREHPIIYEPYIMTMHILDNRDAIRSLASRVAAQTAMLNAALNVLPEKRK